MREFVCIVFAVLVLLWMIFPVLGAERDFSLTVVPSRGGQPIPEGKVLLCRVAVPDGENYRLTGRYTGRILSEAEAFSPEFMEELLAELPEAGRTEQVTREGALFSGLGEGLYLAIQTEPAPGYSPFGPFLVRVGEDGADKACPKVWYLSPQTGEDGTLPRSLTGMLLSGLGLLVLSRRRLIP